MNEALFIYALLALAVGLICGLLPIFSRLKENADKLRILTCVASGIILASALIVVIPEGFELATSDGHDDHGEEGALAGSLALVVLEVEQGEINASEGLEEMETLLGGHDEHEGEEGHDEEEHEGEEDSLSQSVLHVIEEFEDGEINATTGIEEISAFLLEHSHAEEEEEHLNEILIGGAILGGFLLMLILEGSGIGHAVHEEHHDHSKEHHHGHVHHSSPGWLLVFGLTLHSATDGLAIGAALASGSTSITAAVALAVLIHKGPAAFSLGMFSLHEREERKDSIRDVVIFSLATPVMMLLAFVALEGLETHLIGLAMLFSAGTFLYVATVDTLPDIHNPETGRSAMLYVLLGAGLLTVLLFGMGALGLVEHAH